MTAQEFNEIYPVGTAVTYFPIMGEEGRETKTRSEAWELGHGAVVVLVEGQTGGVSIDHLAIY